MSQADATIGGVRPHVFIDESRRGDRYVLGVALVEDTDLRQTRRTVASARLPGQRRVHFVDERDARRARLLAAWLSLPVQCWVVEARVRPHGGEPGARVACLQAIVRALGSGGRFVLVIESRAGRDDADARTLAPWMGPDRRFIHRRAHEEPLLWIPDGIAWSWGAGTAFRKRLDRAGVRPIRIPSP